MFTIEANTFELCSILHVSKTLSNISTNDTTGRCKEQYNTLHLVYMYNYG